MRLTSVDFAGIEGLSQGSLSSGDMNQKSHFTDDYGGFSREQSQISVAKLLTIPEPVDKSPQCSTVIFTLSSVTISQWYQLYLKPSVLYLLSPQKFLTLTVEP